MRQTIRIDFMLHATRCGLAPHLVRKVTALAMTHNRLAEAECNGDYPCDNGQRAVLFCSRCGAGYVRAAMYRGQNNSHAFLICKSCRTEDLIRAALVGQPVTVEFQGDPRGWTVKLDKAGA